MTDSAGIRIVTSTAPEWTAADAWRIDDAPVLAVGRTSGAEAYLFSDVAGALRLADGGLVVADARSRELRFFDATGTWVRTAGGPGRGPGEIRSLFALSRCGTDTIFAFDLARRAQLFTMSGEWVRQLPQIVTRGGGSPQDLSCGARRFVGTGDDPWFFEHRLNGRRRAALPVRLYDLDANVLAELGTFEGFEYRSFGNGARLDYYSRRLVHGLDADGIYVGNGDGHEVGVFGFDGALAAIFRWTGPDLAFTAADLERHRERRRETTTPSTRQDVERELREWQPPEAWPAYQSLRLDPAGDLWLEDYDRRDPDRMPGWTVLAPDGKWLGRVDAPPGFRVTEIGLEYVVGVRRDSLDVERVEVHRLEKPGSART